MLNGFANLNNFREEFRLINDNVQGVCNTRKFQKHCFGKYHTWFSRYVPSFRKIYALHFPFTRVRLSTERVRPFICLPTQEILRGLWTDFFNIWNWVFLMTLVDILRFSFQRRWNNIKCVCEAPHDGGLLLDIFTTLFLKLPTLRNKVLPPSSGPLNSVKWNLKLPQQYVLSKRRNI